MQKRDIRSYSLEALENYMIEIGEKKFRAKQLYGWIVKGIQSFDEAVNMPKGLRVKLEETFLLDNVKIIKRLSSEKDQTTKFLYELWDGHVVEGVLMSYKHGYSICVSTQVGCRMGCTFCASTLGGMVRHLSAGEIMGQLYAVEVALGIKISNIVLMGSGEPLDNYEAVLQFLKLVNDPAGYNLGMRHITLSTCGIADKIEALADENLQLTLAISLHCANDAERTALMPINKKYNLERLMAACRYYTEKTNRRITFEYGLIAGVNDTPERAKELGMLIKGMLCHVNLIPINQVVERNYQPSKEASIAAFKKILENYGITTTIRRELGSDINAACGQLRNDHLEG
ncbi:MAG: 23S rRNA (adenine(2503)-C(2))-methyltransferase RlmN [Clostridia bacterium]|nr:23S rRNA (adenine(2503)-C(2))-methyltransferase RlmN [Clostridia bacterium]